MWKDGTKEGMREQETERLTRQAGKKRKNKIKRLATMKKRIFGRKETCEISTRRKQWAGKRNVPFAIGKGNNFMKMVNVSCVWKWPTMTNIGWLQRPSKEEKSVIKFFFFFLPFLYFLIYRLQLVNQNGDIPRKKKCMTKNKNAFSIFIKR